MRFVNGLNVVLLSRPTRGEWIEITCEKYRQAIKRVSPHTGRVD